MKTEPNMNYHPSNGDSVFGIDGRQAVYLSRVPNGMHAVAVLIESRFGEDESETDYQTEEWRSVYPQAPHEALDLEIASKKALLSNLRDELAEVGRQKREAQTEIEKLKRENSDELSRLNDQKLALRNLRDFIDGKITHFVMTAQYGGTQIKTFDEALKREYDGKPCLRLLSLYGESGGKIVWKISEYQDGSGSKSNAVPCTSLEDAQKIMREVIQPRVDKWLANPIYDGRAYTLLSECENSGIKPPEALSTWVRESKLKNARDLAEKQREQLERAENAVREIEEKGAARE